MARAASLAKIAAVAGRGRALYARRL